MAPPFVVEWAKNGSYLALLAVVLGSSLFVILGLYALSGAGLIGKLPLLKFGLYTIAIVCIITQIMIWIIF